MYSASQVAKYVLRHETEKGRFVSNLRLQKLLYFCQVQSLVTLDQPCFEDEIEAWDFGPVVPNVYQEYKRFGASPIFVDLKVEGLITFRKAIEDAINAILDTCSKYSTSKLVEITHNQDPWKNAYHNFDDRITNEAIKAYYAA